MIGIADLFFDAGLLGAFLWDIMLIGVLALPWADYIKAAASSH